MSWISMACRTSLQIKNLKMSTHSCLKKPKQKNPPKLRKKYSKQVYASKSQLFNLWHVWKILQFNTTTMASCQIHRIISSEEIWFFLGLVEFFTQRWKFWSQEILSAAPQWLFCSIPESVEAKLPSKHVRRKWGLGTSRKQHPQRFTVHEKTW